ncbi:adenine nucleotide alpha hydrolases-likesuperfamily protein [Striga asiatica]|uniref:Adenine nucleotide alpha hydrolases-likesuperfamily protein n=1 Tax=Striga asiatica TaxID=4170 RepID=A0A5A7P0Y2_STRAF|nr:adenine nucleotide alpha hydrolases-likesuperfamily protein [Striga asiatica]
MSSSTLKLSSLLLSSSSISFSSSSSSYYLSPSYAPPPFLRFPRKLPNYRGKFSVVRATESDKNSATNAGDSKPPNGTLPKSRREILLEYVQNVKPEFMELFVKRAPQQVVDAMRQTVTNMIGTLPSQFFAVTVTTVAENLAQLMYSVLMTGYMFRNAQYRLELQQSLEQVALPEPQEEKDVPDYAPGTQKKVSGEVIRWNNVSGPETIDAVKYIELLEAEIEELNRQVARNSSNGQNELLAYLKTLEPQNLKLFMNAEELENGLGLSVILDFFYVTVNMELTSSVGEDAVAAMNTFIKRLLAVSDPSQMKTSATETSAPELAKLLYWLMVVGYSIRNIEVRFDMERLLGAPPKLAELPPGENI